MPSQSLKGYYQENNFNPVLISLETSNQQQAHFAKRRNLYENHLNIPWGLLRDRSVIEFGCNSGENALVLGSAGARLTLVEPNSQVLPRLKNLFQEFGLEGQIIELFEGSIESFSTENRYDIVLAEGFLYTLSNRDEMVANIANLLLPNGLGVISFNDRFGGLLEMLRRMLLWRTYQLANLKDAHGQEALALAKTLYQDDFARLNASRTFEAWWKDTLVNPFLAANYHWSYLELLPLIEKAGCAVYSTSPKWTKIDNFSWYKNVSDLSSRHQQFKDNWSQVLPFFLTGLPPKNTCVEGASPEVIEAVATLVQQMSDYTLSLNESLDKVNYPTVLDDYLENSEDQRIVAFNREMKRLYIAIKESSLEGLISTYHQSQWLHQLWGSAYQYLCFSKIA